MFRLYGGGENSYVFAFFCRLSCLNLNYFMFLIVFLSDDKKIHIVPVCGGFSFGVVL